MSSNGVTNGVTTAGTTGTTGAAAHHHHSSKTSVMDLAKRGGDDASVAIEWIAQRLTVLRQTIGIEATGGSGGGGAAAVPVLFDDLIWIIHSYNPPPFQLRWSWIEPRLKQIPKTCEPEDDDRKTLEYSFDFGVEKFKPTPYGPAWNQPIALALSDVSGLSKAFSEHTDRYERAAANQIPIPSTKQLADLKTTVTDVKLHLTAIDRDWGRTECRPDVCAATGSDDRSITIPGGLGKAGVLYRDDQRWSIVFDDDWAVYESGQVPNPDCILLRFVKHNIPARNRIIG